MFSLLLLVTSLLHITLTKASSVNSQAIFETFYGPQSSWPTLPAITIDPTSIIDGSRVNTTFSIGYGPFLLPATQSQELMAHLSSNRSTSLGTRSQFHPNLALMKRQGDVCFNSGNWVFDYELWHAVDSFCALTPSNFPIGTTLQIIKKYFQDDDGSWNRFTQSNTGRQISVYFAYTNFGGNTSVDQCRRMLSSIIGSCGHLLCNTCCQDSAGGHIIADTEDFNQVFFDPNDVNDTD